LSGGERNRVLLAKLLLQHGNVLALDEPTNDLDLPTLRALEEALCAFEGVVLVVSHDRYFLDRVCTRVLYLDGGGNARFHEGDIESLLEQLRRAGNFEVTKDSQDAPPAATGKLDEDSRRARKRAANELKNLPARIEQMDAEAHKLDQRLADSSLYLTAGGKAEAARLSARRQALTRDLEALYTRWQELEALASSAD